MCLGADRLFDWGLLMKTVALRDCRDGVLFVVSALVILVMVVVYSIVVAIWMSFCWLILVLYEDRFIGLDHYRFMVGDVWFWIVLGNTVYFMTVVVSVELAFGLGFVLLFDVRVVCVEGLFRWGMFCVSIFVFWVIFMVVLAKFWVWFFDVSHGLIPKLLSVFDVDWLGLLGWAMYVAILVDVWKTTSFVTFLLFVGLQGIFGDVYRVAVVDGVGFWRMFRSIILLLFWLVIVLMFVFCTFDAFCVFDVVYVLIEGGFANIIEMLSIYVYKTLMCAGDFGYGFVLLVVIFVCVMIFAVGYLCAF